MATSSREARRRKIIDRSSDRLALITGRLQTLPPSPSPDSPSHLAAADTPDVSASVEDKASRSTLPEDSYSANAGPTETDFVERTLVPPVSTVETNAEATNAGSEGIELRSPLLSEATDAAWEGIELRSLLLSEATDAASEGIELRSPLLSEATDAASEGIELRSPLLSATDHSSSDSTLATERHIEPRGRKSKFFTPNQISSAISATERTRLFCSVAFATVVVLSYLGFPMLGNKFLKSVLSFRPLFLVLLTNVTAVVAQLLEKQRSSGAADRRENRAPPADGNDLAGQLGKTLEIGLLVQKVVDAVFMDCAIYAVIVVCGLSFAEKFR